MAKYNEKGEEIPDPTPVEMPVGYEKPESLESMIARMIRTASIQAAKVGTFETFEEADDFDDEADGDLKSQFQMTDMEEEAPRYVEPERKPVPDTKPEKTAEKEQTSVSAVQPTEKAKETMVSA